MLNEDKIKIYAIKIVLYVVKIRGDYDVLTKVIKKTKFYWDKNYFSDDDFNKFESYAIEYFVDYSLEELKEELEELREELRNK